MPTTIRSCLVLTGHDFDPDILSRRIGLQPTKVWKRGDQILQSRLRRKHTGWERSTPTEQSVDLGAQVGILLGDLGPHVMRIRDAQQDLGLSAEIACVIYIEGTAPSAHFDRSTLDVISQLNAEIDLDIYVLPDGE